MSIDDYMRQLRARCRLLQCSWWDIRVCVNRDWHRKYWRYVPGEHRFECEVCKKLEKQVSA